MRLRVAGPLAAALLAAGPAWTQTEVGCLTAADVVRESSYRGATLTLYETFVDRDAVDRLVKSRFGAGALDEADMVQVFYLGNGRYLVMASVQGCHVAHMFSDDAAP